MTSNTVASLMDGFVSRDEISRGSQCRHGHPRRGRQPRHDHTSVKAAVSEVVQRRDSAFADHRACENDRVPQTPLWELADASTLFSAVAALRPGRASVFHDRSEPPRSCPHLPTLACAWIDDVLPDQRFDCAVSRPARCGQRFCKRCHLQRLYRPDCRGSRSPSPGNPLLVQQA
jgi:hypothetical protein